jgi:molecular chaperone GrpE
MSENQQEPVQIPVNGTDSEENDTDQAVIEPEIMSEEEIAAQDEAEQAEDTNENDDETAESQNDNSDDQQDASDDKDESKETNWKDAYVRLYAVFENYRKRTSKEQDDIRRRERERVLSSWLDVYDNAERALTTLPEKEGPWYEGFTSLVQQMDKCLTTFHIKPIDDLGKKFDPKRHEAIATCPNPNMENNTIMHVEKRGFEYENGDIARVARVIVVKNPS